MHVGTMIAASALVFTTAATETRHDQDLAAPAAGRILLWRDLYAGMSKADVKARYPGWKGALSRDCPVKLLARFKQNGLVSVLLLGRDTLAPCYQRAADELEHAYGAPAPVDRVDVANPIVAGGTVVVNTFQRHDLVWKTGGKTVRLVAMAGRPLGYNLIFTTRTHGLF